MKGKIFNSVWEAIVGALCLRGSLNSYPLAAQVRAAPSILRIATEKHNKRPKDADLRYMGIHWYTGFGSYS